MLQAMVLAPLYDSLHKTSAQLSLHLPALQLAAEQGSKNREHSSKIIQKDFPMSKKIKVRFMTDEEVMKYLISTKL